MTRYIALLRGINVSGKNKIDMKELKSCLEDLHFEEVKTYLNSGNVVFSCNEEDVASLTQSIEKQIKDTFGLDIPVFVIRKEEVVDILCNAPEWWDSGDKNIYDNLIFLLPPLTYDELYSTLGEPKPEYEKAQEYKNAVFWSFDRENYRKSAWWSKTASSSVAGQITIRTAGTIKKLVK